MVEVAGRLVMVDLLVVDREVIVVLASDLTEAEYQLILQVEVIGSASDY